MLLHFIWTVHFNVLWLTTINCNIAAVTEKISHSNRDFVLIFYDFTYVCKSYHHNICKLITFMHLNNHILFTETAVKINLFRMSSSRCRFGQTELLQQQGKPAWSLQVIFFFAFIRFCLVVFNCILMPALKKNLKYQDKPVSRIFRSK